MVERDPGAGEPRREHDQAREPGDRRAPQPGQRQHQQHEQRERLAAGERGDADRRAGERRPPRRRRLAQPQGGEQDERDRQRVDRLGAQRAVRGDEHGVDGRDRGGGEADRGPGDLAPEQAADDHRARPGEHPDEVMPRPRAAAEQRHAGLQEREQRRLVGGRRSSPVSRSRNGWT